MPKQKFRGEIASLPKIELDERLDPAFAPELNQAINELIFRTRNALISHYNVRQDVEEQAKKIDKLEEVIKVLRKHQQQKKKSVLNIKDKKKLR